jgi:hypothetical protein
MKKVLILAYDFPPYISVGGLRPYSWYKHLKEYGIEPIVITRQWGNQFGNGLDYIAPSASKETIIEETAFGTIVKAPYSPTLSNRMLLKYGEQRYQFMRKTLTGFSELLQYFLPIGAKKSIYTAARTYLKSNQVDAIIATGDPFVLFHYANLLSKEFHTPWIADYRDPWSQNVKRQKFKIEHFVNQLAEKKALKTVHLITCVNSIKDTIQSLFPSMQVNVLANGYDGELIDNIASLPQASSKLTFSIVGTIYNWHPWKSVVKAFSTFLEQNEEREMQLNFYGINCVEEVKQFVQQLPQKTQASIAIYPRMENAKLLEKIAQENVMILFNYYHFDGTKIYDYLAVKRQILLCYSNDSKALKLKQTFLDTANNKHLQQRPQIDVLNKTNGGIIVENEAHFMQVLNDLHQEFVQTGKIACHSKDVEQYSRKIQVGKLAELIHQIVH